MIKRICTLLIPLAGLALTGCTTTDTSWEPAAQKLGPGPQDQFECADRNGNDYIDRAELVYLRECGIGEDLQCGDVPETVEARPSMSNVENGSDAENGSDVGNGPDVENRSNFEAGRRMLEIIDADRDERISKLEFRAHCNSTGRTE